MTDFDSSETAPLMAPVVVWATPRAGTASAARSTIAIDAVSLVDSMVVLDLVLFDELAFRRFDDAVALAVVDDLAGDEGELHRQIRNDAVGRGQEVVAEHHEVRDLPHFDRAEPVLVVAVAR